MRADRRRLLDILEAIERIGRYASRGRDAFEAEELIQNWITNHLWIIGEACNGISDELRDRHPGVPWRQIIMRTILVHEYFGIDTEIVWSAVERDLPPLQKQVELILSSFDRDP